MVIGLLGPMSSIDIEFGEGRHGGNVRHYIPSPAEIEAECRRIREEGFTDRNGNVVPQWTEREHYVRATGRLVMPRVDVTEWSGE